MSTTDINNFSIYIVTRRVKGYTRFVGKSRVKGYTRFVGKYYTGRRKRFRPHKVYTQAEGSVSDPIKYILKGYTRFVGKYVTNKEAFPTP